MKRTRIFRILTLIALIAILLGIWSACSNGGDELTTVTIPWTLKGNGSPFSVDLVGKTVISARVQFRGVGKTTSTTEYKTSPANIRNYTKSGGVWSIADILPPPVPSGYIFDRITAAATVTSDGSVSGEWEIDISFYDEPNVYNHGTGVNGYGSQTVTDASFLGYTVSMGARHEYSYKATFSASTRGKKVTTVTTQSENPSIGNASYSGSLADGVTTDWQPISLTSNTVNSLPVSVGGSGLVYILLEYTVKDSQAAPSTPDYSSITPSSVDLTSSPGSLIVCNEQTKASGSTWTGLSEQTSYSAYAYYPETTTHERSPNSGSVSFRTPSSAGPPSVTTLAPSDVGFTSAVIAGNVTSANGDTPTRHFRWGYSTTEMVFEIPMGDGIGQYSIDLSGLEPGTTYYYQAYAINKYGTGRGAVLNLSTPYPMLEAPVPESPGNADRIQDRRPWLIFTLIEHPANSAESYHAKARISEYSSMSLATTLDSSEGIGEWEYWDGSAWRAFPASGVAPGTRVRCRTTLELPYRTFYWDCAAYDGLIWGVNSNPWMFKVLIAVTRTFSLVIADKETVGVKNIMASETCNGELGEISFDLFNKDGQADAVNDNDLVILGINDTLNNSDEFRALVREKKPVAGKMVKTTCVTGDGILADRIVKQNYPAQDIGLSLKHAIDTYCAPLTSVNIDASTGIVAALSAKDVTVLQLFEQVRRDYSLFFHVDNTWDVHLYDENAIQPAIVQIQYGDNGINLMGGV